MNTLRKTLIASMAAVAMIAAGSIATPTQAHAGNLGAALLGGAIVGGLIAATAHARPVYRSHCWYENQFVGYDQYNRQVFQKVQVCQ